MTETLAPAVPSTGWAGTVDVRIEDDASPIVRLIGRTLRDSTRAGHTLTALRDLHAVVGLRSHDTPQAATITLAGGVVTVTSGVVGPVDATITVDVNARFAPFGNPDGDADTVAAVLDALHPPIPDWRDAAASFWTAVR